MDPRNQELNASGRWLVVTDLDGTLLDHDTYDWRPAEPALRSLQARGDTIALCSSKTRAELELIAQEIGLTGPLIPENGASGQGIAFVRQALHRAARASRCQILGFGAMTTAEIMHHTGLPEEEAYRASLRDFDEPFLLLEGDAERLASTARGEGLHLTRGGRFWHAFECGSKGEALTLLRKDHSLAIALGDSENDRSMLSAADIAIVIPGGNIVPDPQWRMALHPGPRGWNQAMLDLIAELR